MIQDKNIDKLIEKAVLDLTDLYAKICRSEQVLSHSNDAESMMGFYAKSLSHFVIVQILEFAVTSKILDHENRALDKKQRFKLILAIYNRVFSEVSRVALEQVDKFE